MKNSFAQALSVLLTSTNVADVSNVLTRSFHLLGKNPVLTSAMQVAVDRLASDLKLSHQVIHKTIRSRNREFLMAIAG